MKKLIKKEDLPLLDKRKMIELLYTRIAQTILPLDTSRIKWMQNYIRKQMTETDINREWGFIISGQIKPVIKMLQQLQDPNFVHPDKEQLKEDLARFHQSIAEGLHKYKSTNTEIDRETYKFMSDILMNYTKKLNKSLLGTDKKLLLSDLQKDGLEAKNPDQSYGMISIAKDYVDACRIKGFSDSDIKLMLDYALKNEMPNLDNPSDNIQKVFASNKENNMSLKSDLKKMKIGQIKAYPYDFEDGQPPIPEQYDEIDEEGNPITDTWKEVNNKAVSD